MICFINRNSIVVILWCLLFSFSCYSQNEKDSIFHKNKVGAGAFYYGNGNYLLSASYARMLKNKNELEFPLYVSIWGVEKEIAAGVSYNWAFIKKDTRFNLYFSPAIYYDFMWYHDSYYNENVSSSGPFLCIGLIPALKISRHFIISFEGKIGFGYMWGKNDDYSIHDAETGKHGFLIALLKLQYRF